MSYFGNRTLRHVAADMDDVVARGFTGVLHTFSENDLFWYRDQMTRIVAASHAVGLTVQVNPWGLGHVFGGEAHSLFMAQHPELGQVFADDGRQVGAGCPSQPAFVAFVRHWAEAAVASGADMIFWDEPHFAHPSRFGRADDAWACICDACAAAFHDRFGHAMPAELTPEVQAFRDDLLATFVRDLVAYVDDIGGTSTVCLLPPVVGEAAAAPGIWEPVASAPGLDTIATDPYWSFFEQPVTAFVGDLSRRVADLASANGINAQIWIQGFKLGPEQEQEIHAAVAAARGAGVSDIWTWGYDACAHMSHLRGRDPERVWDILTEAITGWTR